jgi:hypothetical protein
LFPSPLAVPSFGHIRRSRYNRGMSADSREVQQKRSGAWQSAIALMVAVIVLAFYSAAYYRLCGTSGHLVRDPKTGLFVIERRPSYRFRFLEQLFEPMHQLDRKLFPKRWKSIDYPPRR